MIMAKNNRCAVLLQGAEEYHDLTRFDHLVDIVLQSTILIPLELSLLTLHCLHWSFCSDQLATAQS